MLNASRNYNVFHGLDREINEFLRDSNSFREEPLNALRTSKVSNALDPEINELLKEFRSF